MEINVIAGIKINWSKTSMNARCSFIMTMAKKNQLNQRPNFRGFFDVFLEDSNTASKAIPKNMKSIVFNNVGVSYKHV